MSGHERLDHRQHGLGLGQVPLEGGDISGNPAWPVSRAMVICGSRRRSLENPGSRNPSPASVSMYKVLTSQRTRLARPSRACAAQTADSSCRHACLAYPGSRGLSVAAGSIGPPAVRSAANGGQSRAAPRGVAASPRQGRMPACPHPAADRSAVARRWLPFPGGPASMLSRHKRPSQAAIGGWQVNKFQTWRDRHPGEASNQRRAARPNTGPILAVT